MELFPAYRGRHMEVNEGLHHRLVEAFPWLNVVEHYRVMDLWLEVNPKRRPKKCMDRFIVTWLKRQPKPSLKDLQAVRDAQVGRSPIPEAVGARMRPEALERARKRMGIS